MVAMAIAADVELVRNLLHDEFDNITLSNRSRPNGSMTSRSTVPWFGQAADLNCHQVGPE